MPIKEISTTRIIADAKRKNIQVTGMDYDTTQQAGEVPELSSALLLRVSSAELLEFHHLNLAGIGGKLQDRAHFQGITVFKGLAVHFKNLNPARRAA